MIELELLGPHTDGSQLVFTDKDGERYLVVVDDALKAAIRRGEIQLESVPAQGSQLRPREIQQLLRAGMQPAEIASTYDVELGRINRFLSPIIAERNFVIRRALRATVGAEPDSPTLGDLTIDRLATRGVDSKSMEWNALREDDNPWELHLNFIQAAKEHHASWQVANNGQLIRALDDEARWLTETTAPALNSSVTKFPETDKPSPNVPGEPASGEDVEKLLDELSAARGRRQPIDVPDEDVSTSPTPSILRFPHRKSTPEPVEPQPAEETAKSAEEVADEPQSETPEEVKEGKEVKEGADTLPGMEQIEEAPKQQPTRNSRKSKRRSVPSWDEIVFGTRGD